MLLRRLVFVSLLLSLAAATVGLWGVERVRTQDRRMSTEWTAASLLTDLTRARCEANPRWFLAGPRENAPSPQLLADPDADVLAPRPDSNARPVEFFVYDVELVGQSTAAPRLTASMRAALQRGQTVVTEPLSTGTGTGAQTAVVTGWDGPCAVLLVRMHPPIDQQRQRAMLFGGFALGIFIVTLLVAWPVERRIRRVGSQMRASARTEYREPAAVTGRDELSQLAFAFNEAALDITRLQTDVRDRDADQRRLLAYLTADAEALLHSTLTGADYSRLVEDALRLTNSVTGAHLRDTTPRPPASINVGKVVAAVVAEFEPLAARRGAIIDMPRVDPDVQRSGDALWLAQGLRNIMMFALDRQAAGGKVTVELQKGPGLEFSLRVTDAGPRLGDADIRQLNAVRRFRGDEGRGADLRGDIGLGLAVVHEICHRLQLHLTFEQGPGEGLSVTLASGA